MTKIKVRKLDKLETTHQSTQPSTGT